MSAACHAKKHPAPHSQRVENERAPQVAKRPTTFPRISEASTTRAVCTPVKAGERKEKVGRFRREVERFSFLLPHFHRRLRVSCSLLARAYTRSASFLIFAFTAALLPFNLLIFSALWVKIYISLFLLYCLVSQRIRGEGTICALRSPKHCRPKEQ